MPHSGDCGPFRAIAKRGRGKSATGPVGVLPGHRIERWPDLEFEWDSILRIPGRVPLGDGT